jgi:hypothetical protein
VASAVVSRKKNPDGLLFNFSPGPGLFSPKNLIFTKSSLKFSLTDEGRLVPKDGVVLGMSFL